MLCGVPERELNPTKPLFGATNPRRGRGENPAVECRIQAPSVCAIWPLHQSLHVAAGASVTRGWKACSDMGTSPEARTLARLSDLPAGSIPVDWRSFVAAFVRTRKSETST